jgi:Ca2+-binding EF-hand superfamily protein
VASTPTPPRSLKLAYSSFLQVLLDFQLIGHTHFLAPFVALFRCVDTQRRGLLDEAAFRRLVASVAPQKTAAEVEELLMDVDPFNHQIVTFSDCVVALGKDLVALLSAKHQDGGAESAARG